MHLAVANTTCLYILALWTIFHSTPYPPQPSSDDPPSWSYPSNQTKWISCSDGDMIDQYGNYCGITANSKVNYTDEDLAIHVSKRIGKELD